jgi:hypothetical protein
MKYFNKAIIFSFLLFFVSNIYAQEHSCEEHDCKEHTHKAHSHSSRNEIGFSTGAFYGINHKEWGSGLHLHYFRTLKPHSKWALGAGFEQVWVDGSHFNVSAGVRYHLLNQLSVAAFPGVTFVSHKDEHESHLERSVIEHEDNKPKFTMHFELVYDFFHWRNVHFGAVLDYAWKRHDSHAMIGIHTAICF